MANCVIIGALNQLIPSLENSRIHAQTYIFTEYIMKMYQNICQRGCFCLQPLAGKLQIQLQPANYIDICILYKSSYCIPPQIHIIQHIVNLC